MKPLCQGYGFTINPGGPCICCQPPDERPATVIDDGEGLEEYAPIMTVDDDCSKFRQDEADEEAEALKG
jgi:hypothetical protein